MLTLVLLRSLDFYNLLYLEVVIKINQLCVFHTRPVVTMQRHLCESWFWYN